MLQTLLGFQSAQGGFQSVVKTGIKEIVDENCFITALVLLELLKLEAKHPSVILKEAIEKGIRFIESCEQPGNTGRFSFYPYTDCTPRLNIQIDPDLDDSALALLVLLKSGRRTALNIQKLLRQVFDPCRIDLLTGKEPRWVQQGLFRTWISEDTTKDLADCCVNLNVLSLYTTVFSYEHVASLGILPAVQQAIDLYGISISSMRRIAPYYTHPAELFYCVERVAEAGAPILPGLLQKLETRIYQEYGMASLTAADRSICCNQNGRPLWFAPALQQARKLRAMLF